MNSLKIKKFFLFVLIFSLISYIKLEKLDYKQESNWNSEYCSKGTAQSPINIPAKANCQESNSIIKIESFDYLPIVNQRLLFEHDYKFMVDASKNGHINITIEGQNYKYILHDIHFHLNSEHTIDNQLYNLEVHLVHTLSPEIQDPTKKNQYMVIGLIFNVDQEGKLVDKTQFIKNFNFDIQATIPEIKLDEFFNYLKNVYFYKGGLTTPGCDESVNWIVVDQIFGVKKEVFENFKAYLGAQYPDGNNRQVKPLNNRTVYHYSAPASSSSTVVTPQPIEKENNGSGITFGKVIFILIVAAAIYYIYKKYNEKQSEKDLTKNIERNVDLQNEAHNDYYQLKDNNKSD